LLQIFFLSFVNERKPRHVVAGCMSPHWGPPHASPPGLRTRFNSGLEHDCGTGAITPEAELIFESGGFSRGHRKEGVPTRPWPRPLCLRQYFSQAVVSGCFPRRAMEQPQEWPEPRRPHQHPEVNMETHRGALSPPLPRPASPVFGEAARSLNYN
jgi:hypothetical protein